MIFQPGNGKRALLQPDIMQMQGRISTRKYANAGAYFSPKLCKCMGVFQPERLQNLLARISAHAGASPSTRGELQTVATTKMTTPF